MKHLYSRLTLITSITLIMGYVIVSATWTSLGSVGTGDQLSADRWNNLVAGIDSLVTSVSELDTRTKSFSGDITGTWDTTSIKAGAIMNTNIATNADINPSKIATDVNNRFITDAQIMNWDSAVSSQWTSSGTSIHYGAGNVGIGTTTEANSKLQVVGGDVYIQTQGNGVILRDTDGMGCHRLTVDTVGTIAVGVVTCP